MDCSTTCFVMGTASPLLALVSFLVFSAVALYAMRGAAAPALLFNRVPRPAWFCRSEPSPYRKRLAVHVKGARERSTLE